MFGCVLGPRFTNAISCFEPGPQEPYFVILLGVSKEMSPNASGDQVH
jgi:hypothetical protein